MSPTYRCHPHAILSECGPSMFFALYTVEEVVSRHCLFGCFSSLPATRFPLPCCWSLMSRTSSSIHIAFFLLVFICYVDGTTSYLIYPNSESSFTSLALPDLVVMRNNINPFTTWQTFGDNSCAVYEGCTSRISSLSFSHLFHFLSGAQQGNRRLLRFTTQIYNQGTSDVVLGNPNNNPGFFTFSSCHHHYHRKDVVQAVLLVCTSCLCIVALMTLYFL